MIIVKNRELLIPGPERYIGTTYDTDSENRQFLLSRFAQNGVDLSALTFRLDLKYANDATDTVVLDKEVTDTNIILTWNIGSSVLQVPGTLFIQLRAADDEVTVKWSSFHAALYVERHLNTPGSYTGSLTEIEQMEQDHQYMLGVVDELKSHLDYTHEAEAWAIGKKDGEDVPSTDETYHNNSKYYSEQAGASATAAANSATAAAGSATQAAETVADTNTRFNNAVAAVTVDTEVIDARVGADGTTYPVLKSRLDAEHTDVKSALDDISDNHKYVDWVDGYIRCGDSTIDITDIRTDASDRKCMVVSCVAGDVFTISGGSYGTATRLWAFCASDGTSLGAQPANDTVIKKVLIAPETSAYLIINWYYGSSRSGNIVTVYKNKLLTERVAELADSTSKLNSYYDVGFNIYDGSYHAESAWKTAICEITSSEGHWCTDLIPVDPSKGLRVRVGASAKPYKLLAYDSSLRPNIGTTSALWAIDIASRAYVSVTFDNSVDPSEVMIAYTNETSGATSDKWDELFPNIGYVPYYHVLNEEKVHIESCEELRAEFDEIKNDGIGVYDSNSFFSDVANVAGASILTDDDGLKMAYFHGTAATKNWMSVKKNVQAYQVAVVEFTGKSSHPEYDPSVGAMLIIEFLDKNNAVIGSKYNGFVLGATRCGFHRYGAVAPKGAVKVSLRFTTRASTDMWIKSVAFRVLNVYPMQNGNRIHGHLGMIFSAPKNTMPAFEMSKAAGFNTVVTNVKATQDGVLVALHDNTINATSDGTGNVSDYTYAQLLQYDFGSWFSTYYTGTKIPTIDSVMKFFCASGIRPGLSLHAEFTDDTNISTLCGILKKYGFGKRCLVKSFSLAILDKMHAILGDGDELEYFLDKSTVSTDLIDTIVSSHSYLTGVEIVSTGVNSTIVEYAKAHGLEVSTYYGNDIAQNKEFIGMGVTRFCTDTFSDTVFPTD